MPGFDLQCVLFDLDGTLVDTAPDLIACLQRTLLQFGLPGVDSAMVKPQISSGALAMIRQAAPAADDDAQQEMLAFMLTCYQDNIATHSRLFPGFYEALSAIEAWGLKWGVVTNKRQRFTLPLMEALGLTPRAACIVSGDSTGHSKPHPAPMFAACASAGVGPKNCVYIGDALHDITAGKSANMKTLAATYGYLRLNDEPRFWGADGLIENAEQLTGWIKDSLCR